MNTLQSEAASSLQQVLQNARADQWRGWDPYDALSSPLLRFLSLNSRWGRIAWIQLLKRSPVNLRPFLFVPKSQNPKALALFASAEFKRNQDVSPPGNQTGEKLLNDLLRLRSQKTHRMAWGYPFDWQSRAFFAPQNTPNVVVTSFCANAFLDGFEITKNPIYLDAAKESCEFILNELHRSSRRGPFCFSYTPLDHSRIHNANLLAAALLCRTGSISNHRVYVETGMEAANYSLGAQREDGSWVYGEASNQQWIDSFHTGFNLLALDAIITFGDRPDAIPALRKGFQYYVDRFFLDDGTPRYFSNSTWPIDIHSAAVAIEVLSSLAGRYDIAMNLADPVLAWTFRNMKDSRGGHFFFQKHKRWTNRIQYMRWADAWMTQALAAYLYRNRTGALNAAYAAS